ncbi:MAG: AAC(3) family N-acetyltransferase [Steroidobacteraceae bacterium]
MELQIVKSVSIAGIAAQLRALGVREGDVVLAHVSFRAVRPVEGGPQGLIEALHLAVGPCGTIVMPSWGGVFDQPFEPTSSAVAAQLGAVAASFWRLPGALRSSTPFAFAARGPAAASILSGGLMLPPHQPDSPVGKVVSHDGRILLLGLNHDSNTTLHLAESLAGVPYEQRMRLRVFEQRTPVEREYFESRHCFRLFARADAWMDEAGLQASGQVGNARARLMRARDLVDVVVDRLRRDPFSFLHLPDSDCAACNQAWRSVAGGLCP